MQTLLDDKFEGTDKYFFSLNFKNFSPVTSILEISLPTYTKKMNGIYFYKTHLRHVPCGHASRPF